MLQQSMRRHTPNDLVVDRHSSPWCASDFAMMTEASCALPVWRRCMRRVDWPPGRAVSLQVDSTRELQAGSTRRSRLRRSRWEARMCCGAWPGAPCPARPAWDSDHSPRDSASPAAPGFPGSCCCPSPGIQACGGKNTAPLDTLYFAGECGAVFLPPRAWAMPPRTR